MSVLTLAGKPIDWSKPPKATDRVMWSRKATNGKTVIGSLRAIAWLDHVDTLAFKKYGVHVVVIQGPFNTGVAASEGTHDFDQTFDLWIPGVSGPEQQRFFRANGGGAYLRVPPTFSLHIHVFVLPEREGADVSDDFRSAGFVVGKYVDGGWSTAGARIASSQIEDYYGHRNALAGHAHDPSWFPANIAASIFNLNAYIARKRNMVSGNANLTVLTANVENAVAPPLGPALKATKPTLAVLQQASKARASLRKRETYRLLDFVLGAEARGVKTLARKNVKVARVRRLRMTKSWVGPKMRIKHKPRVMQAIRLGDPYKCWVINVHFPTGGPSGPNAAAWHEAWDRLVKFLSKRRGTATGDFNATANELERLCKAAGFQLTSVGKVDHAVSHRLRHTKTRRNLPGTPANVHGWGAVTYDTTKEN